MQEHTKKHLTDELVTVTVRVRRSKVAQLERYAEGLEAEEERQSFSVAEVFPKYAGKEKEIALRAYRNREGLTQKRLAEMTGIPQHHISEMENGKRSIGKGQKAGRSPAVRLSSALINDNPGAAARHSVPALFPPIRSNVPPRLLLLLGSPCCPLRFMSAIR